jgi:NAD(P)-dependent dehydrogenase (short-subunit alcohol dehydrogenase family)
VKDFKNKVAVITGAASGIGRALAERAAQEGMKVVLADIEEKALAETAVAMRSTGATVLPVRTDVSKADDVESLAQKAWNTFGAVHLLCSNAGVGGGGTIWERSLADWQWVLGVNLWGVIHGVHAFVPRMIAQDTECHVVNTASLAGLVSPPMMGIYCVSKHGVVTLSEVLYHELTQRSAQVKVSVLCPGFVNTRIMDSARNRPAELQTEETESPEQAALRQMFREWIENGMPPAQVAECVFNAMREDRFYILTHPESQNAVRLRMEDILQERNPTNPRSER